MHFGVESAELLIELILSIENWTMPNEIMWFWIVLTGNTGLAAHYCMAKALMFLGAMVVVPLDF